MLQVNRENYCLTPLIYLSCSTRHYGQKVTDQLFLVCNLQPKQKILGTAIVLLLGEPLFLYSVVWRGFRVRVRVRVILQATSDYSCGGKDGAVVRTLASHHCGLVQICGLSLLFGSLPCSESFFLRFFPLLKNQHFQIPIRLGMVDEQPLCGCATSKSLLFEKIRFIWVSMYSARKY